MVDPRPQLPRSTPAPVAGTVLAGTVLAGTAASNSGGAGADRRPRDRSISRTAVLQGRDLRGSAVLKTEPDGSGRLTLRGARAGLHPTSVLLLRASGRDRPPSSVIACFHDADLRCMPDGTLVLDVSEHTMRAWGEPHGARAILVRHRIPGDVAWAVFAPDQTRRAAMA